MRALLKYYFTYENRTILLLGIASFISSIVIAKPLIDKVKPESTLVQEKDRKQYVGRWLGEEKTKDQSVLKWLMIRRIDGGYTVTFKEFKNSKMIFEQTEAGYWGVVSGIYFTMAREVLEGENFVPLDVSKPEFYDAYKIIKFDGKIMRYKNLESNTEFQVEKMSDTFKL